ncbi:MAG: hypothetical protein JW884_06805 [Deltaproteobacteria bacterium]|nr:hypothetical protein [Deltaproteobacteria bacterium]
MNKIKVATGIAMVFILGMLAGVLSSSFLVKQRFFHYSESKAPRHLILDRLDRELSLTEDQRRRTEKILDRSGEKIEALSREYRPMIAVVIKESLDEIEGVLRDDQKPRFHEIREKMLARHMRRRPPP